MGSARSKRSRRRRRVSSLQSKSQVHALRRQRLEKFHMQVGIVSKIAANQRRDSSERRTLVVARRLTRLDEVFGTGSANHRARISRSSAMPIRGRLQIAGRNSSPPAPLQRLPRQLPIGVPRTAGFTHHGLDCTLLPATAVGDGRAQRRSLRLDPIRLCAASPSEQHHESRGFPQLQQALCDSAAWTS